ncbi:MAG: hypothetical protein WDN00_09850 [Limisphaerales bacterium]
MCFVWRKTCSSGAPAICRIKICIITFRWWHYSPGSGLGADGLSSSCYGPEAAFLALKTHTHLSLFVALASVLTIVVICASYSQIN